MPLQLSSHAVAYLLYNIPSHHSTLLLVTHPYKPHYLSTLALKTLLSCFEHDSPKHLLTPLSSKHYLLTSLPNTLRGIYSTLKTVKLDARSSFKSSHKTSNQLPAVRLTVTNQDLKH